MRMGMKVYDVSPMYEYFCVKEVNGATKIWGAYFTYYRWEWDKDHRFRNTDKVVLFSGTVGKKFRFNFSYCPNRIHSYFTKHQKDGYTRIKSADEHTKYPFIHDGVSKLLMWHELRK